jgi:hypothetical protein
MFIAAHDEPRRPLRAIARILRAISQGARDLRVDRRHFERAQGTSLHDADL